MSKDSKISTLKTILQIIIIAMLGCAGIIFTILYVDTFKDGFWYEYSSVVIAIAVSIISILSVLTITFLRNTKAFVYKLFLIFVVAIFFVTALLYLFKITGVLDKFDTIADFRKYVESFGSFAVALFIIIQFLQVVILPIPAFITVGAGVLLFGPFYGALFSCIGIILGSLVAFFIGRVFGVKVVKWLIGEDNLNKGLKSIKGKDKVILTFMFLFPFFPDDILCFVAGITTISPTFFIIMIIITRLISVFVSAYSMNNSIIPYDTWWGILLWAVFFAITIIATILIYKHGEKIEKFFSRKKEEKRKKRSKD